MGKAILCALLVCGKILLFALLAVLVLVVLLLCARIGFRLRVHADGAVEVLARVGVFYPNITKLAAWRAAWRAVAARITFCTMALASLGFSSR